MNLIKQGFIYYLLATIFGGLLLMFYIQGDSVVASMDAAGWLFFLTSCLSHAAILLLALWLVFFLPWALLKLRRLAATLFQYAGVQDLPLPPQRIHSQYVDRSRCWRYLRLRLETLSH